MVEQGAKSGAEGEKKKLLAAGQCEKQFPKSKRGNGVGSGVGNTPKTRSNEATDANILRSSGDATAITIHATWKAMSV